MYLAFIHIGRYDIKARRHLACVQNGITQLGDWRMETWQLALRARCHVSIRQSPSLCNAILNTCPCLLAIIQYVSDNNKNNCNGVCPPPPPPPPWNRLPSKPSVSDPGMHHGMCVTHVPWCMSGLLTRGGGENTPGILGACATRNFTYLARGPLK